MSHFPLTIKNIDLFEEKLRKEKYATALVRLFIENISFIEPWGYIK